MAATVLCAWSHPGRCRSDAAFAMLSGAAPIPASSGQTIRVRLNRMATRRVIVQELPGVGGFVAGPSGELEFFEAVSDYGEVDQDNLSILGQVDTILLGSETYRLFVEYGPTAEGELVAELVNSTPKIVFSSTLDSAPWGRWEPARLLKGSAVDHVQQLRREPGRDIMVWGSISRWPSRCSKLDWSTRSSCA